MSHVRQQIRERVGSLLTTAAVATTISQSRVFIVPAGAQAALIYTNAESVEPATLTYPRKLTRTLSLMVEVITRATLDLDDALDALCVKVEEAIAADYTLNGLADDTVLASTAITHSFDGDAPIGSARMEFLVSYRTVETDADTAV
jgi:hypothetical protein